MPGSRPVLVSVVQYQELLKKGALSTADVIARAAAAGAEGLELRRDLWPSYSSEVAAIRRLLDQRGLLRTWATYVTLFAPDAAGQRQLIEDIETAHRLGSPFLRVFQGEAPALDSGPAWDRVREAVRYAERLGVRLCLENRGAPPGNTLAELLRVLRVLDSPVMVNNFDIGNYDTFAADMGEAAAALGPRIVCAHLKDNPGKKGVPPQPLGRGTMRLPPILAILDALPQLVFYCFEFVGGDDPEAGIAASLDHLRRHSIHFRSRADG